MVSDFIVSFRDVFSSILGWVENILNATGGTMFVLSAVVIALVASLFVLPVRGRGLPGGVMDFTMTNISGKYGREQAEKARLKRKAEYQERVWKHNHAHWRAKHTDFRG